VDQGIGSGRLGAGAVVSVVGGAVVSVVGGAVVSVVGGAVVSVLGGAVVSVLGGAVVSVLGGAVVAVVGGSVVGGSVVGGTVVGGGSVSVGGGSVSVTGGRLTGGGSLPGSAGNDDGKLVTGPLEATGWIGTDPAGAASSLGSVVVKPRGESTEANRPWSFWVRSAPGAIEPDDVLVCEVRVRALSLLPSVTLLLAAALAWGPRAAAELEPPGRRNATSDTTAKTKPATSMVASICSSALRARRRRNFGTRPMCLPFPTTVSLGRASRCEPLATLAPENCVPRSELRAG
jgi:hypothetical protein